MTLARFKRSFAGRLAQRRGDDAEDIVEQLHNSLAFKREYPTASLMRRYAGKTIRGGKTVYTSPQGPDFGGGVEIKSSSFDQLRVGLWVEVEVKFVDLVNDPRLRYARFTDAEIRKLNDCDNAGGRAILLVLVGAHVSVATWCAVPWAEVRTKVAVWRNTVGPTGKKIKSAAQRKKDKDVEIDASCSAEFLLTFETARLFYLENGRREGGL